MSQGLLNLPECTRRIEACVANCPQHILPRWTEDELAPVVESLKARVEQLERENQRLRDQVDFGINIES